MIKLRIDVPIYNATVVVYLSDEHNIKQDIKNTYNVSIPKIYGDCGGSFNIETNVGTRYILWVDTFNQTDKRLSTFHHESIHIANFILSDVGVETSVDNDEALAYLSEFVFLKIINHFFELKSVDFDHKK